MSSPATMNTYPRISAQFLRASVGNTVFNSSESISVVLDGERTVLLKLIRLPLQYENEERFQTYLSCPRCERPSSVLRVVPDSPWLLCRKCTHAVYRARYLSQDHFYRLVKKYTETGNHTFSFQLGQ